MIIESVEFDDMRIPPNKYKYNEPEILEIYPELFYESKKPPPSR